MNCQKCRTPLRLDQSFQDLNPAAFDLLVGQSTPTSEQRKVPSIAPYPPERKGLYDGASKNAAAPLFKRTIPPPRKGVVPPSLRSGENGSMSFVMLPESQLHAPSATTNGESKGRKVEKAQPISSASGEDLAESLSYKVENHMRLFEILSARSDVDYPICSECTDILLAALQVRLVTATKERDAYIGFLKELTTKIPTDAEVAEAEKAHAAAKASEAEAMAELLALEKEKAALEDQVADLEADSRALDLEEEAFWRSRNDSTLKLATFQEKRDALNAAYDYDTLQLERLQRTNVYNDTFCIGHDGNFGTINGLRLGRLSPPNNVEWSEINAAWGTTVLLLATVADKLGFSFRGYKLRPMGSTSHIDKIEAPSASSSSTSRQSASKSGSQAQARVTSLELFSSGDLPLIRTILHRNFNDAMTAFLECLRQLGEFVEDEEPRMQRGQQSGGLKLPYKIDKDKIGGLSIKLGISQDEAWTSACKYTLTCCKFLLAHASNVAGTRGGRRGAS